MKKMLMVSMFFYALGCGPVDETYSDNVHPTAGGAYSAEFSLLTDDCVPEKANYTEWIWADVWPVNTDHEYRIAFWQFDFKKTRIYEAGLVQYRHEDKVWPVLYIIAADGHIWNKHIDLVTTVTEYSLDINDQRTLVCTRTFGLHGTKFLDYPDPPQK